MVTALCTCSSCLPDGLYSALLSFSGQLLGSIANPWDNSDAVYQVNAARVRKKLINCACQFLNYWTLAKIHPLIYCTKISRRSN